MNNSKLKICRSGAILAITSLLSLTSTFADAAPNNDAGFDSSTLTDWNQKTQTILTQKLDAKLTLQLSTEPDIHRFAEAQPQQYHQANLVLVGKQFDQFNVTPLSSIPVVILVNPEEDCLLNL